MKKFLCLSSLLLSTCAASQAYAEDTCGPSEKVFDTLINKYGEAPVAFGDVPSGQMVVWANYQTQTFTVSVSKEGVTCLLASGEGFVQVEDLPIIKPNL